MWRAVRQRWLRRVRPRDAASHHLQAPRTHRRRRNGWHHASRRTSKLEPEQLAAKAYGATEISERHRHRYEFNREYEPILTGAGLRLTGTTPDATYVEIVEIPTHPFFLACQFHPEFKSKPLEPHPLFRDFVGASYKNRSAAKTEAASTVAVDNEVIAG